MGMEPDSDHEQARGFSGYVVVESLKRSMASVKVAHFDCFSGISGDMTLAALIDAGVDADAIRQALASLELPITLEVEKVRKGGFAATAVHGEAPDEPRHRGLAAIDEILQRCSLD